MPSGDVVKMGRFVLARTLAHVRLEPESDLPSPRAHSLVAKADDIFPQSHGPELDVEPEAARQMSLSEREIAFFKEFGYIIKRGLIPAEDLRPWVDNFWDEIVPPGVDRSDPATWIDPAHTEGWGPSAETIAESERMVNIMGRPPNRAYPVSYGDANINWTQIGGQPDFVDVTCAHPNVLRTVQALIGGPVKRPHRNRGTYVHFPRQEVGRLGPHNDTMPAELFGMVYLSDVPPRSGGTTIWPTSPQRLWSCLESEHRCGFNPNEKYSSEFGAILDEVKPTEFVGATGDVIFL